MRCLNYLKRLKDVFEKKNYDFDRSDVDLTNFHPQILVILAIQGVFYGRRDSLVRYAVYCYIVLLNPFLNSW